MIRRLGGTRSILTGIKEISIREVRRLELKKRSCDVEFNLLPQSFPSVISVVYGVQKLNCPHTFNGIRLGVVWKKPSFYERD